MRAVNRWLTALIIVTGGPYYWFLLDSTAVGARPRPVTIARLRDLAREIPGARPSQIRYEFVGTRQVSGNLVAAGMGLRDIPLAIYAFQLVMPGRAPITIDAGLPPERARRLAVESYRPAAQARIDRAVAQAAMTVTLGAGAGAGPRPPAGKATGQAPVAVAPGVVLIPATGLPAGTRMLFVQTADAREYLFTGDIAPIAGSWQEITLPARWMTSGEPRLDRAAMADWLKTVRALERQAPGLAIVEGHDVSLPDRFVRGFQFEPAQKGTILASIRRWK
ncbi:hypothetical protein [Novosphingobium album (ex Liu et al. 2023)]|uniref:Uncharacterized protein n=1 Tax=Novosphingobium album (ex Liu et al. 2023) TaxID=3031130 RepID=A0ABT5WWW5_9SPHN|nr:hypothetical protein [Novosphingobium album (ex Liu et al. 2023)]MDE8654390.1 hypothetical protein [Novosphingobium album (ex Liu et al. 2023)]